MVKCNTTLEDAHVHEIDLDIGIKFHHLGLILSALSGLISIIIAGWLLIQHALHYSKPWEQKHIIRILFMIPIYSMVSFLSYYYYQHAIYYQVLRDCYEAFAIASFFTLLCHYLAPNLHEQKEYFRKTRDVKNWVWPMNWVQRCTGGTERGMLRIPKSGLTWFNIIYVCVFQYCFIRVFFTIVSVIAQATDRYCEDSLHPAFAHIWVLVFEGASVTVAMYGLIQFYVQLKPDIAEHRPFLKLLCIKLVIFFSFWQTLLISFLSGSGVLVPGKHISWPDIRIGIPSMLLCMEMAIFAVMHIFAFPWRGPYAVENSDAGKRYSANSPYVTSTNYPPGPGYPPPPFYQGGRFGWKAIIDAFNPWDIIKASARGFRWLFVGVRHRREDASYQDTAYDMPSNAAASKANRPYPADSAPYSTPSQGVTAYQPQSGFPQSPYHSMPSNQGYYATPPEQYPQHPQYPQPTAYDGAAQYRQRDFADESADLSSQHHPPPYPADGPSSTAAAAATAQDSKRFSFEEAGHEEDRTGLLAHAGAFAIRDRSRSGERGENGEGDPGDYESGVHPAYRRTSPGR